MNRFLVRLACSVLLVAPLCVAQQTIQLYPGAAPGTPAQTFPEKQYYSEAWHTNVVTNVSQPTLTVFKPTNGENTGSAVVICPGGGYMALSIDSEGNDVARYLAARGMTAFVLKYRLAPTDKDATQLFGNLWEHDRTKLETMINQDLPLAVADGVAAVAYVRQHAAEWGVAPDRVGIMGFSAGGGVTVGVAYGYKADSRPAFVAPIYAGGNDFTKLTVPADAPPMFIAAATDDNLGLAPVSLGLYRQWTLAKKSAELHMYARGGHGFGMRKQNIPTDHWIDRFAEWLELEGFLKKQ
ncbi:alpha/beta hydrolase [Occallatibacter riparius]|uniref:Alpha/beta hydrolase n=1 Tax=Occallatibacter riparius TaxID=1002689 RepID=A0A9J7BQW7_9BACT|nr:alpha/beta hydrolase [Occallatibacter riparius]UWZ84975.1 alpha/beta hydrolase [Occallatibacter riparius]